jgi:hypothetical protein
MSFRIAGLEAGPFVEPYGLSEAELAERGVVRVSGDEAAGLPDRIELRDVAPGESALLLNHTHQSAATPYRASHAIYVREGATATHAAVDTIPPALRTRLISLRAFDASHMMIDAEVAEGAQAAPAIEALLADPRTAYIQAHYARFGCYAAQVDRA